MVSLSLNLAVNILLFSRVTFRLDCRRYCPRTRHLTLIQYRVAGTDAKRAEKSSKRGDCSCAIFSIITTALTRSVPSRVRATDYMLPRANFDVCCRSGLLSSVGCVCKSAYFFRAFNVPMLGKAPGSVVVPKDIFMSRDFTHEVFKSRGPVKGILSTSGQRSFAVHNVCGSMPRGAVLIRSFIISIRQGNNCRKKTN